MEQREIRERTQASEQWIYQFCISKLNYPHSLRDGRAPFSDLNIAGKYLLHLHLSFFFFFLITGRKRTINSGKIIKKRAEVEITEDTGS